MPTVLDWSPTVDPSEFVRVTREAVAAGSAVVLPGDCGYVVLMNPTAPGALAQLTAMGSESPPAVLAWSPDDPAGLGLVLPIAARRLLSRGWPAPLIVAVPGQPDWPSDWPVPVRERVGAGGMVRFRCPEHPVFDAITPVLELPALVVDAFLPTAEAVLDLLEDSTAIAVSAGTLPTDEKPTVVTVTGVGATAGWEITRPGLLTADEVERLAARIVLFVCTGNTCRSPLAEGLAKKMLADRLRCGIDELPRHGFWVVSAGIAASAGSPAASESLAVAAELGADLGEHESRSVNPQLLAAADDVIVMTRGHAQALTARYPGVGPVPRLLCGDADLDDPIGSGLGVYRECARTIQVQLERFLPGWTGS